MHICISSITQDPIDPHGYTVDELGSYLDIMKSDSDMFYPSMPSMEYLSNLWKKEIDISICGSWKELHDLIK